MADDIDTGEPTEFDWGKPGQRPFGCSERQVKFARAVLSGHNYTQAAKAAGYVGDEKTLRSQGSRSHRSPKVAALLRAAQESNDDQEPTGDWAELEGILWKEARQGANPTSRTRAAELIVKHMTPPGRAQPLERVSDLALIRMLEGMRADPIWSALCLLLAQDFPADGFDTPEGAALRGHRMPQRAWEGLVQSYPAVADVLRQKGCGGHRDKPGAGKTNGCRG